MYETIKSGQTVKVYLKVYFKEQWEEEPSPIVGIVVAIDAAGALLRDAFHDEGSRTVIGTAGKVFIPWTNVYYVVVGG